MKHKRRWPWILAATFVGVMVIGVFSPKPPPKQPATVAKLAEPLRPAAGRCIDVGEICRLRDEQILNGVDWVPTATSPTALNELKKAIRANDKEGLMQLLRSGAVLPTKSRDEIRLLDVSVWDNRSEGRMVSGSQAGRKVWVFEKWVVK